MNGGPTTLRETITFDKEMMMMMMMMMFAPDPEKFHAHLDKCKQCEEHPFNLCSIGCRLLTGLPAKGSKND